jgi:Cd2+/Zn2+-exporting ATPase
MDCPDCARRIRDRLVHLEGVAQAEGHPVSRRLVVEFDPSTLTPDRIRAEVGRLGYVAEPLEDGGGSGSGAATARAAASPAATGTWRSREAVLAYVSAGLFAVGLLLSWLAPGPALARFPRHALHAGDLAFLASALVGGWNFFPKGVRAARTFSLDMNFLMTVAILGATGLGEFLEAGAIAFLFAFAELLEDYSVDRARRSIEALMELAPERATVERDGSEQAVRADEVEVGEVVVVRPGEKIPVDGRVIEGASAVNEAPITGESMPVDRESGDEVFAGTIVTGGFLRVRTEKRASATTLARIVHLVQEAEEKKAPTERFVERFSRWYTPAVVVLAVIVAAVPPLAFGAEVTTWLLRGLTLLVIACPCALVISTPVAVVSGITAAARRGVLIKGGTHLEAMGRVRAVALDKTGTLTHGHPELTDVVPLGELDENDLLAVAAALEARSEHPVAGAILRGALDRGVEPDGRGVSAFEGMRGLGVSARLDGEPFRIGRADLFDDPSVERDRLDALEAEGKTVVLLGRPDRVLGLLAVADRPRPGAAEAIRSLRRAGIRHVVMLTGDNRPTAEAIAAEVGIDEVHAGLLPEQKVDLVRQLEERYGPVAMVGDGVNDGPALAAAHVGVAMGVAGSDVALETADVALMGDDLSRLAYAVRLSHRGRGVIRENISASIVLKALLAAGVPLGLVSLALAVVVGDMGAALGVTGNSLRLARLEP